MIFVITDNKFLSYACMCTGTLVCNDVIKDKAPLQCITHKIIAISER